MKNATLLLFVLLISTSVLNVRAKEQSLSYEAAIEYYNNRKADFSPEVAYEYFQDGAKAGDTKSKVMAFALLYEFPNTLAEFAEEAIHFLVEAARTGDLTAQFNLGLILSNGFYVEKNIKVANDWLKLAAENGDRDSSVLLGINLAHLYTQNEAKARLTGDEFEYITSHLAFSEQLENTQGLLVLASLYFMEKRNLSEARRLLNLATELGDEAAPKMLQEFEEQSAKETKVKNGKAKWP